MRLTTLNSVLPSKTTARLRNRPPDFSHLAALWQSPVSPTLPGYPSSGQQFAALDRLLEKTRCGPFYLRQPSVADMMVRAIHYNADILSHYALHAFVVMPNHVHLLLTPAIEPPKLTKSLKGITAKRASRILGLTGNSFWQEESYDRLVRTDREFEQIRRYIENNPVRAGLVQEARRYQWSSAGWQPGGCPADAGVRPTEHVIG